MKFRLLVIFLLLPVVSGLVGLGVRSAAQSGAQGEPKQTLQLPEFSIRDPWMLAYTPTGTYYLYASNDGRMTGTHGAGVMVYKSRDLKNWVGPVLVFTVPEGTWADRNQGEWVPEVHEYRNRFYLFVTLHNPSKTIAQPPEAWKATQAAASMPNQGYRGTRLHPTTDAEMLASLDMLLPGMEAVKNAAERNDLEAVKAAYLEFRRKTSTPRWFVMPSGMPAATATDDATGDEILHHVIRDYAYGNNHRQAVDMGADFDWTHNPLPENDPNFTHEWTWCAISRMQFWRKLGEAYWKTHDEKYAREWVSELEDFAKKEPLNPDTGRGPVSLWRTLDASIRANDMA